MPLISISQLLDKTIWLKKPSRFFRTADVIKFGDKAKPVSNNLKTGYSFKLHSFFIPAPDSYTDKYGVKYAPRSKYYWLFYGQDGKYYAIEFDETKFSLQRLLEQGVKTIQQQQAEQKEEEKTPIDKVTETFTNLFTGAGNTAKTILYIGVGVFALGYLLPKFLKK